MSELVGVVLAGGKGTRLGEITKVTNKHLLPVGEFPMIYYPIKKLAGAGIKEILIVSGTEHMGDFVELLGSGKQFGVNLTYKVQDEAGGIAQALGLAERFCNGNKCVVILGDNIFYEGLECFVSCAETAHDSAYFMLKEVEDPSRYGVTYLTEHTGRMCKIVEKPDYFISNLAVTGIYSYPPDVFDVIKTIKPSKRGELEITDVNNHYIKNMRANHQLFQGYWTDAGTPQSLTLANNLVTSQGCEF